MRKTVLAPEHNKIACREVFAAPVVVVSVTSASVLKVVVPAMAESNNAVISVLTVLPHVPDSSPVTGKAKPKSDVYEVDMVFPVYYVCVGCVSMSVQVVAPPLVLIGCHPPINCPNTPVSPLAFAPTKSKIIGNEDVFPLTEAPVKAIDILTDSVPLEAVADPLESAWSVACEGVNVPADAVADPPDSAWEIACEGVNVPL